MKRIGLHTLLVTIASLFIGGCASQITNITDTITLYPNNKAAHKWGIITHYQQYLSNAKPSQLTIKLPNNKEVSGQIIYLQQTTTETIDPDDWYDDMYFGFGHGFGGRNRAYWGWGFSMSPRTRTVVADNAKVSLNTFGDGIAMHCDGKFNHRQLNGTLDCKLTNGMTYKGNIRRVIVR